MCFFSYGCHPSFFYSTSLFFPLSLLYIFSLQMMPIFIGFNGSSSCTYQQWWLSFVNGWCSFFLIIFSCHQQSTIIWQNLVVIFEKSHSPHMKSFLADIWSVDRYLSQVSNTIEFASIGLMQL